MVKNKIKKIIYIFLCAHTGLSLHANRILTFQLEYYPLTEEKKSSERYIENLSKLGQLGKNGLQNIIEQENGGVVSGIFCSYAGFLTTSDINGRVTFPLLQTKPLFYLLITTRVTPVSYKGNTIHHWKIEEGTPTSIFTISKEQDEATELYYWNIQETDLASVLPNKREIPAETITIYARPKDIFVPTGITPTTDSPNAILPDIYVRKNGNLLENALYIMNLNYLFRNVNFKHQERTKGYSSLVSYP